MRRTLFASLLLLSLSTVAWAENFTNAQGPLVTPLKAEDLDPAAFTAWTDGAEKALEVKDGPRHVLWTQDSRIDWDGVTFSESKTAGVRHMRIGWKTPVQVGAILARGTAQVSVLKSGAKYPGDLNDATQWVAAERVADNQVSGKEPSREDYVLWVLPQDIKTQAVRFTHEALPTDSSYAGWLGGVYILSQRMANVAPLAVATASANDNIAAKINNSSADGGWSPWDNGKDGGAKVVTPENPEWVVLAWPKPVTLCGLSAIWAGFSEADVQVYAGPADRHPREAAEADWKPLKSFTGLNNGYPIQLWPNWMVFDQALTTRAVRVRMTKVTTEGHPHLNGNTKDGKRVWLGELMAMQLLGDAALKTALAPSTAIAQSHPPIPIHFQLDKPGFVTLVIEDEAGKRVRNLISETKFPAGDNTAWWDGMDDLGRDVEAARHGIYRIPSQLVTPGKYRVRGLVHEGVDLRFEFSVYNAGTPAWTTADRTGGWLTNHTPPSAALYVPGDKTPNGKPMVYLGSYVSEGGDGLAWVGLDGKKYGGVGWVGGAWTGAPFLARDAGGSPAPKAFAYVASSWSSEPDPNRAKDKRGEIRLTALTPEGDKPVLKYFFFPPVDVKNAPAGDAEWGAQLGGLAVHNGTLVFSLCKLEQLVFVDAKAGKVLGKASIRDPRGLAFDAKGRLLALVGKQLHRYTLPPMAESLTLPKPEILVEKGLENPLHVTFDSKGNFYISDRGTSHQVKVFDPAGKPLRAIGVAGEPKAGPYNPLHMNNPNGLTIDADDHLWVTETDYQPKRVSVWTLDGKLLKTFYGPSEYGGGGALDPEDKSLFYYHGMQFQLDWRQGQDHLVSVFHRPGPNDLKLPDGYGCDGVPQTPLYRTDAGGKRQRYFTNCYNSNPTGGSPVAVVWIERGGLAVPVAALGRVADWSLLKGDNFKAKLPSGIDRNNNSWGSQAVFAWSDLNEDSQMQPDEVAFIKGSCGGITVMPDLALVVSRMDDRAMRYPVKRFTAKGVPVYDLAAGEVLVEDSQSPTSSGGDQALVDPNGWTILTVAPKPFAPQSMGGAFRGKAMWSYPSLWPGLHASHESPAPEMPGELIGTTRLLGGILKPHSGEAGSLWAINGNQGNMYVFTTDGLFVTELFRDVRKGTPWAMPKADRGMLLNGLSLHDENFWPSITQTADGQVYLVDGGRTSLIRVDGLDKVHRIALKPLTISADDLKKAQDYFVETESRRQKTEGRPTLKVAIRKNAPTVDGKCDDWAGADWAIIDRSGVAAFFDSNTKPYDVTAAVAVAGDRLYAAFRSGDARLLENSGETPLAPFKTGGALDLMIGANSQADPQRNKPVEGDIRLLLTLVKNKPVALVYRAVTPGAKEKVPFSSPWRTITFDAVDDVSGEVQFAANEGNYELSIPLKALGLKPQAGQTISGDVGTLRGNGFQTLHRVYWSNKATGITADVPSEAELSPQLWGKWQFTPTP